MQRMQNRRLLQANINISPVSPIPLNPLTRQSFLLLAVFIILALLLFLPETAQASMSSGLPYEKPLYKILNFLVGPIFLGLSLAGVLIIGSMLIFGLDYIPRFALIALLAAALIILLVNLTASLFSFTGAELTSFLPSPEPPPQQAS